MKTPVEMVTCPACAGVGGESDIYDEYDDCPLCDGKGSVSAARAEDWRREEADTAQALAAWTRRDKH